jgi:hypothetical protein
MATRVLSGARSVFSINSQKLAYAGGVSGQENIDHQQVDVLDMLAVLEHAPVGYRASLNANLFRIVGTVQAAAQGVGVRPGGPIEQGGSIKLLGIMPKETFILRSGSLTATIQDKIHSQTAYRFDQVKTTSRSFDIRARSLVTENIGFNAIRVVDEAGQ